MQSSEKSGIGYAVRRHQKRPFLCFKSAINEYPYNINQLWDRYFKDVRPYDLQKGKKIGMYSI